MAERAGGTDGECSTRFDALVAATGDRTQADWLATSTADPDVRRRVAALADAVAAPTEGSPAVAYEASLDPQRRRADGHFVTDDAIASALCRWAIQPRDDGALPRVLDPAAGSGVFPAAASARLGTLAPDAALGDRLAQLVGIETDPVSLALAADRLLPRDPSLATACHLYEADFFDVEPGPDRRVTVEGTTVTAGRFDAVVGNPPYVRQESVDADRLRGHLDSFGPPGERPYSDGERALSRRSDAYVYFLTHATRFLRDGGRLGVVVPSKWLTTRYGKPFRQFLFDQYRTVTVVGFGSRAFDDAFVDTVLLLAERDRSPAGGEEAAVRLLRVDDQVSVSRLAAVLATAEATTERPRATPSGLAVTAAEDVRQVSIGQATLAEWHGSKLAPYLDAPEPFLRLLSNPRLTPLSTLASVERGTMTGANEFFLLDASEAEDLAERFRRPAIKSVRDASGRVLRAADTDRYMLDVHEYVESVRQREGAAESENVSEAVRDALAADGYDGLAARIDWGEQRGFHERRSCASRSPWFDLGKLRPPTVFVPKFFDRRVVVLANPDGLVATNAVDCLWPADEGDRRTLLGVLNSTVAKALLECWGRNEGGGALQIMTYELASLPVPDPRSFPTDARSEISGLADAVLDGEESALRRLDALVLDGIDSDLSVEECRSLRESMVQRRVGTGERTVAPLVTE